MLPGETHLLSGFAAPPRGYGVDANQGGPAPLVLAGAGRKYPQTARPTFFSPSTLTVDFSEDPDDDPGEPGALVLDGAGEVVSVPNPVEDGRYGTRRGQVAYPTRFGVNGDVEHPVATLVPHNRYNSRSVTVHLPAGIVLAPAALARLRTYLRAQKALTVYTTVRGETGELEQLTDIAEAAE